jgi:hypothetical protein
MAREFHRLTVAFTVHKSEHLPLKDGEQMYADDVCAEIGDVIGVALAEWYRVRGHDLLTCEPTL